jgi:hypothetical protein
MGTQIINTPVEKKQGNTVWAVYHGLGLASAPVIETVRSTRQEIIHTPDDNNSAIMAPAVQNGGMNP